MENNNCGVLREDLIGQAESFIRLCYGELEKSEPEILERISAIHEEVLQSGTYKHTEEELTHGARVAWRHNSRCIGRLFWHSLEVIDARGRKPQRRWPKRCWPTWSGPITEDASVR